MYPGVRGGFKIGFGRYQSLLEEVVSVLSPCSINCWAVTLTEGGYGEYSTTELSSSGFATLKFIVDLDVSGLRA